MILQRIVVPSRFALIYRAGSIIGYNPGLNTWERLTDDTGEVIRWLRAGRDRSGLTQHLSKRFDYDLPRAEQRLEEIIKWCILRRLLYLDSELKLPDLAPVTNPLATVYWICTQACNLRCTYCYQDAALARRNELTTAEGKDLIDQVVESGARTFIFTGGEPFVRRDLLELARYSRERNLKTNIITNGHYINKKNISDIAGVFHNATISLDHMIPEHHDAARGKGSWMRAVRAIELLLEASVSVDVNSVLARFGLDSVEKLLNLSRQWKVGQHRIIPQFPMGRGGAARADELMPDEVVGLSDRLHVAAGASGGKDASAAVSPEGRYGTKRNRRNHCGAGLSEVSVDPEGWVYPCRLLQYPQYRADNIRSKRIKDIFDGHIVLSTARSNNTSVLEPCRNCIIKNHCGGGCRGIHTSFTDDYLKTHPLFCAYLRRTFEVQAWSSTGNVPIRRRSEFIDHTSVALDVIPASSLVRRPK